MSIPFIIAAGALGVQSMFNAKAASDQAEADAENLLARAALERLQAADATARGHVEEGRSRMASSMEASQARADATSSEIDTSSGTPASVFGAKAAVSELDALMIRSNAAREAWGHEVQAQMDERAARSRQKQGRMAVLGSFLGGAAGLTQLGAMGKG